MAAWERADVDALVALLHSDARLIMPPRATWFDGAEAIGTFFAQFVFSDERGSWRVLATGANRQLALGVYRRGLGRHVYRAYGVAVLAIRGDGITEIAMFTDPGAVLFFDGLELRWLANPGRRPLLLTVLSVGRR
jgi:RNA polymerase sigma-70 factor (ECF subfamily)